MKCWHNNQWFYFPPGSLSFHGPPSYPSGYFVQNLQMDFFNYAGLQRPVKLYITPSALHIDDITTTTTINSDGSATVDYILEVLYNRLNTDIFVKCMWFVYVIRMEVCNDFYVQAKWQWMYSFSTHARIHTHTHTDWWLQLRWRGGQRDSSQQSRGNSGKVNCEGLPVFRGGMQRHGNGEHNCKGPPAVVAVDYELHSSLPLCVSGNEYS